MLEHACEWGRPPTDDERAQKSEAAKAKFAVVCFIRNGVLDTQKTDKVHIAKEEEGAAHAWAWKIVEGAMSRVAVVLPAVMEPPDTIIRAEVRVFYNENYTVTHIVSTPGRSVS